MNAYRIRLFSLRVLLVITIAVIGYDSGRYIRPFVAALGIGSVLCWLVYSAYCIAKRNLDLPDRYAGKPSSPESHLPPSVIEGIRQAERRELVDLGSFAQYADDGEGEWT